MKILIHFSLAMAAILLGGCAGQPVNTTNYENYDRFSDLIFSTPNISDPINGSGTLRVYDATTYCVANNKIMIGEIKNTRQRLYQRSKLPVGRVVLNGGIFGFEYFTLAFDVEEQFEYSVTLTESRPFLTHYDIKITKKAGNGPRQEVAYVTDILAICPIDPK